MPKDNKEQEAIQNWKILKQAIDCIHTKKGTPLGFGELLQTAHNLIKAKAEQMFYDECRKVTHEHMRPIRERLLHTDDKDLLAAMAEDWGFCMDAFIKVKDFFIPLKKYITRMKLKPIYDLQVEVFKNEVFLVGDMNHKVISTMVKQVEKERNGENMDRVAMTNMVMLIDQIDDPNAKGLYESKFEGPFLVDTKKFYVKLSLQLLTENSAPDYITKIHHMYLDEQDRADSYLRPSTKEKLMNTYLDECITKHAT